MYKFLGGGYVLGVPARDLSEKEWRKLTERQRAAARPLYTRTSKSQEDDDITVDDVESPPEFDILTDNQPEDSTQQEKD